MSESTTTKIPPTPIILHHLNNSRSQRILWLLEELNLNYEVKKYQRGSDMLAPAELKEVHPLGKSPIITDGPHTLAESGAIIEYLVNRYGDGKMKPTNGSDEQLQYTYWLHFAEGTLMFPLLMTLIFMEVTKQTPFFVRPIASAISSQVHKLFIDPNLQRDFKYIESHLEKNEWFAGPEISGADIQMSFPLEAASMRADKFIGPKTKAWIKMIQDRPAYKRALEKGGEYSMNF
ncbi:hypothetical protein INT43_000066 [Umbelopsis isabellina]|uniref:glutathione transferase n=1 Tax=Mortierella isabellina TaxID=91625 RepID=A0A8H7UAN9_MORIS|nr:hypothetical protein INT43_000066 [Umbelopsis isabellina]